MKINGLKNLENKLKALMQSMEALDGEIGSVSFDPYDPSSIEVAIATMEASINAKVGSLNDEIVRNLIDQVKEKFRAEILHRAALARGEATDEQD